MLYSQMANLSLLMCVIQDRKLTLKVSSDLRGSKSQVQYYNLSVRNLETRLDRTLAESKTNKNKKEFVSAPALMLAFSKLPNFLGP